MSLAKFCVKRGVDKKYKTTAQRRRYVTETLKLEIQKDDKGQEGVAVAVHQDGEKSMRKGRRIAVEKIKQASHDTKEEQQEAHAKNALGVNVNSIAEDPSAKQLKQNTSQFMTRCFSIGFASSTVSRILLHQATWRDSVVFPPTS
jgi:hypothetical protein